MSSTLSVSSGQVSLPVTMAGNYRLSLLRNGEAVKTLSVAATSPTPSPAPEPTTAPPIPSESGDNGIGGMLMILVVLVIIGGVAYYFMNQRK
jgi:hypothetical protein